MKVCFCHLFLLTLLTAVLLQLMWIRFWSRLSSLVLNILDKLRSRCTAGCLFWNWRCLGFLKLLFLRDCRHYRHKYPKHFASQMWAYHRVLRAVGILRPQAAAPSVWADRRGEGAEVQVWAFILKVPMLLLVWENNLIHPWKMEQRYYFVHNFEF